MHSLTVLQETCTGKFCNYWLICMSIGLHALALSLFLYTFCFCSPSGGATSPDFIPQEEICTATSPSACTNPWCNSALSSSCFDEPNLCLCDEQAPCDCVDALSYVPLTNGMPVLEKETTHLLPSEMRDICRRYLTLPKYTNNKE